MTRLSPCKLLLRTYFCVVMTIHNVNPMFTKVSDKLLGLLRYTDTNQMNYGVAVTDVDHDDSFDIFIAGFTGPNIVLKYDKTAKILKNIAKPETPFEELMDSPGHALGVCACDIDGDGKEEIYVLNSNQAYAGLSSYPDKLFKWINGRYVDLLSDDINANLSAKNYAGRSVACIDRYGSGKYGILIATYALGKVGSFALLEINELHPDNNVEKGKVALHNVAAEANLEKSTGGRGIVIGPILSQRGKLDIFFNNEGNPTLSNPGENYLMKNIGNGSFTEEAQKYGLQDPRGAGRGVALADLNHDGLLDIICGNYEGLHRLFLQSADLHNDRQFTNVAIPEYEQPSMVRTVLVGDFDNDGNTEIYFNNINDASSPQPNRLFSIKSHQPEEHISITAVNPQDALEDDGFGTGGAVIDIDQDGFLDLVLTHGEDFEQPVEIYSASDKNTNNFLRVLVKTKYGSPARGATVQVVTSSNDQQMAVVDSGSGYLCQMEPVVHFGFGKDIPKSIVVIWPDSKAVGKDIAKDEINSLITIYHPEYELIQAAIKATESHLNIPLQHNHTEL